MSGITDRVPGKGSFFDSSVDKYSRKNTFGQFLISDSKNAYFTYT